jgi:penicillin-binding protein 2
MKSHRPLNDPATETRLFKTRVNVTVILILICFGLLVLRLAYLQLIKYRYYNTLAQNNSIGLIPTAPTRGIIFDRNGKILADNIPVFSLDVTPNNTADLDQTIEGLMSLLDLDPEDADRFYKQVNRKRSFGPIPLKVKLTEEQIALFYLNKFRFPGAEISVRMIRYYPYQKDFSTVLGYTGRINQQELSKLDPQLYNGIDYIGKMGIERYYENDLRGSLGYKQVEMNARGEAIRLLKSIPAHAGKNIYLTIDADLQEVAVAAMKHYRGALVAIEPATGNVLAMVSNPSYDPNIFVRGITKKEYLTLQNSPDEPLFNRAIRGQYPPASTIKPLLALQGLEKNFITPEQRFFDPGYFQISPTSRKYRNWRLQGQGWVNLRSALAISCDTYFYALANKMGIQHITPLLEEFGYGQKTGIQMYEELSGMVPSPPNKRKLTGQAWYPGDTLNSSIGQGISLTTPLQLAASTAIIANRGLRYKPNLLLQKENEQHEMVKHLPELANEVKFKASTWEAAIKGMQAVIIDSDGTGYRFGNPRQYTVAAKTGTAQLFGIKDNEKYISAKVKSSLRDNSMFIAFAPIENPKIAIAIAVQNNPNAAEVARKVFDYYLLTILQEQNGEKLPPVKNIPLDESDEEDEE